MFSSVYLSNIGITTMTSTIVKSVLIVTSVLALAACSSATAGKGNSGDSAFSKSQNK